MSETQKTMLLSLGRRIYPQKPHESLQARIHQGHDLEAMNALYTFLNTPTGIELQGYDLAVPGQDQGPADVLKDGSTDGVEAEPPQRAQARTSSSGSRINSIQ